MRLRGEKAPRGVEPPLTSHARELTGSLGHFCTSHRFCRSPRTLPVPFGTVRGLQETGQLLGCSWHEDTPCSTGSLDRRRAPGSHGSALASTKSSSLLLGSFPLCKAQDQIVFSTAVLHQKVSHPTCPLCSQLGSADGFDRRISLFAHSQGYPVNPHLPSAAASPLPVPAVSAVCTSPAAPPAAPARSISLSRPEAASNTSFQRRREVPSGASPRLGSSAGLPRLHEDDLQPTSPPVDERDL